MIAPEKLCPTGEFRRVRDALVRMSSNVATPAAHFRLPVIEHFNWALDWFDKISTPESVALCICGQTEDISITFQSLLRISRHREQHFTKA